MPAVEQVQKPVKGKVQSKPASKLKTELKPHQQRVVGKITRPNQPGLVVAHGLGSGKTLTSIAAQEALGMPADVLVPAALQENYLKERKRHLRGQGQPIQLGTLQRAALRGEVGTNPLMIIDEAHRAREAGRKTYEALKTNQAQKRLLLTGSPFYNRPSDISPLINLAAGSNVLPNDPQQFRRRYIREEKVNPGFMGRLLGAAPATTEHLNPKQAKNLKKVFDKWVDYEPTSEEGYPRVSRETVKVPMTEHQTKVYDALLGQAPAWVKYKIKMGLPPSKSEMGTLNHFSAAVRQISDSTRAHDIVNKPEEPKIEEAYQRLKKELDTNKAFKAIVYSNYLNAGISPYKERLTAAGIPFGEYTGEMKKKDRDQLIRDYNKNLKRVILLSSAGGEGLDLKGTRLVQLLDPHWNSEKLRQVEGRAIRYKSHADLPEDQQNVRVQSYLSTRPPIGFLQRRGLRKPGGSIDEYLTQMSGDKDKLINQFRGLLEQQHQQRQGN